MYSTAIGPVLFSQGKQLGFRELAHAGQFDPESSLKLMEIVNDLWSDFPEAQLGTRLLAEMTTQLLECDHLHHRIQPISMSVIPLSGKQTS